MISNFDFLQTNKNMSSSLEKQSDLDMLNFGSPVDKAAENLRTAMAIANRDTIHDSLVPLVCEYISQRPVKCNTRFRGVRDQSLIFSRTMAVGEGRVYGAGSIPWVNYFSNTTGTNNLSSSLSAYSSGKLIGTSITFFSEDSGEGNELNCLLDIYKIPADNFSKSYRAKENDKFNSHTRVNLVTTSADNYVIRGPWSLPLEPIGYTFGVTNPAIFIPINNEVVFPSKCIGRTGSYVLTNTSSAILIMTFYGYSTAGVESSLGTATLPAYATIVYNSTAEVSRISSTTSDYLVLTNKELDQAGEDLFVRVLSSNVNILIEIHRVYEVEVTELLTNDITNDDDLSYYVGEGFTSMNRQLASMNGKASLGSLIGSIVSTLAPQVVEKVKDTWNSFSYNKEDSLFSNMKRFFSKAVSFDKLSNAKASVTGKTAHANNSLPYGQASTSSKLNAFLKNSKVRPNNRPNEEDKYNTKYMYPILEGTGMAPFQGSIKTQFDPGFIQVLSYALPGGFQYFPVTVSYEGLPTEVHIVCMIKTHYAISSIDYLEIPISGNEHKIYFDKRLIMTKDAWESMERYLTYGPGSLKLTQFDTFITLDFDDTKFKGVEDESWMAAFSLVHNDAPDGLFTTGAFSVDELGQVLPKHMAGNVINLKLKNVKGLTVFTTGESIYSIGSRPYEELNIYNLSAHPYVTSTWGLWVVSIKVQPDYKDILLKNGVLRSYKITSNVAKNFQAQFNLLVSGTGGNTDKYSKVLGGDYTLLNGRLPLPNITMMGARDRVLNTYKASLAVNAKTGNFDDRVDKVKLVNWITYGVGITNIPAKVFPLTTVVEAPTDVTPPNSISPGVFLNLEPAQILQSLATQLNTTVGQINISLTKNRINHNPSPIMQDLAKYRGSLTSMLTKPADFITMLKILIANVKNNLSNSNQHTPEIEPKLYKIDQNGIISSRVFTNNEEQLALIADLMSYKVGGSNFKPIRAAIKDNYVSKPLEFVKEKKEKQVHREQSYEPPQEYVPNEVKDLYDFQ